LIGSGAYAPIESTVLTDNGSSIDRLSFVDRRKLSKQKFSPTIFWIDSCPIRLCF